MGHITYGYKKIGGKIVHQVFNSDEIPPGWYDAPDKAERDGMPKEDRDGLKTYLGPKLVAVNVEEIAPKGTCPKCKKHIGRGVHFHAKKCKG